MKNKNLALLVSVVVLSVKTAMAMDLKEQEPVETRTTPAQQKGGKVPGVPNPIEKQLENKKVSVSKEPSSSEEWSPGPLRKEVPSEGDSPLFFRRSPKGARGQGDVIPLQPLTSIPESESISESDDSESGPYPGKFIESPKSQRAESSKN
jgi:hypothetical protein